MVCLMWTAVVGFAVQATGNENRMAYLPLSHGVLPITWKLLAQLLGKQPLPMEIHAGICRIFLRTLQMTLILKFGSDTCLLSRDDQKKKKMQGSNEERSTSDAFTLLHLINTFSEKIKLEYELSRLSKLQLRTQGLCAQCWAMHAASTYRYFPTLGPHHSHAIATLLMWFTRTPCGASWLPHGQMHAS